MKLRRILAASDLSPGAERAVGRALLVAAQAGAALSVLHVVDEELADERLLHLLGAGPQKVAEQAMAAAAARLQAEVAPRAHAADVSCELLVGLGRPFEEILRRTREERADLLVLGSRDRRLLEGLFLGTIVDRILRACEQLVLVVRCEPREPYRQVVVPVDFSATSRRALEAAAALAPQAAIAVLHVYDLWFLEHLQSTGATAEQIEDRHREYALRLREELDAFLGSCELGARDIEPVVRPGRPASIAAFAEERGADLIALGTQGRHPLHHWLLGSVATDVVHRASCDVLAVRPQRSASEDQAPG
jgi:nucleotide-binding universal stress UspA family protein